MGSGKSSLHFSCPGTQKHILHISCFCFYFTLPPLALGHGTMSTSALVLGHGMPCPYKHAFDFTLLSYPLRFARPNVTMGIATLRGHKMTFSHSYRDLLRPLSQVDKVGHVFLL